MRSTTELVSSIRQYWQFSSTIVAVILFAVALVAPSALAVDRDYLRVKKVLIGQNDRARIMMLNTIAPDSRSRRSAMPVLTDSLRTLSQDKRLGKASKQGRPDLPDGIAKMIQMVGSVESSESTQTLVQLLDCDRITWTMVTMQALGKYQHHDAIEDIFAQIDSQAFSDSYGFRFTLARALKSMNHPDAWEALAKLFHRVDGQLAHRLDEEFENVTLEDFRGDNQRFTRWQDSISTDQSPAPQESDLARSAAILDADSTDAMPLPKRMSLQPAQSEVSYRNRNKLKPSQYYGIDIYAKRLLFIIDRSGSMEDIVYGQPRIAKAKRELIHAISGLDQQVEFGIIVFDEQVRAWRENLVLATDANKRSATRYIEKLSTGNSTNTYGALRQSLQFDPQLEAIFFLTDGKPTSGFVTDQNTILMDILRRNEMTNITINTIAISVDPVTAVFLQNLTEPSNGRFKMVK